MTISVKPLQWSTSNWNRASADLEYLKEVWEGFGAGHIQAWIEHRTDGKFYSDGEQFDTLDAAKAFGQTQYERRILSAIEQEQEPATHQARVAAWMLECFGPEITKDRIERADRFVEEALELAQSIGWTADRGHALVDYVFGRPVGEVGQEVGGVMVTLAALCNVFEIDIEAEAKREVDRITRPEIVLKIRAKQAAKPTGSALPIALDPSPKPLEITEAMIDRALARSRGKDLNTLTNSVAMREILTAALSQEGV